MHLPCVYVYIHIHAYIPGNSLWPFWDGENVSKWFLCDLWRWNIFLSQPGIKIIRFLGSTLGWLIFIPGYVDFYTTEWEFIEVHLPVTWDSLEVKYVDKSTGPFQATRSAEIITKKSPVHILCKDIYKYVYENTWNPNDPLFLKVNPPKQGLFQLSNKGHLGSRYTLRIQVCPKRGITPIHSYSFRMGLEPEKSYSIREG